MAASYADWKAENYVQYGGSHPEMGDGTFLSGAYLGVFAGPPRLSTIGGSLSLSAALEGAEAANQIVYPIGLTQNFNIGHNKQWSRIFELGSHRSYFIPGRSMGQVGFGRMLYHGPSLLRVLYAYYNDTLGGTQVPQLFPNVGASAMPNPHDVQVPPGYENFFINLASDLFDQPIGLLVVTKDNKRRTYGAFYLESCVIPNHSFSTDAQGVIMQEQVALQFEQLVPISTRSIRLIS